MINDNPNNIQKAKTCNEACAQLFPQASKLCPAFIETESCNLNEPSSLHLLDLNDEYWVLTLENAVFVASENQFRQYDPSSGIYAPVQESAIIQQIISSLNQCAQLFPSNLNYESFASLKNRTRIKTVVERARDVLQVDDSYFLDHKTSTSASRMEFYKSTLANSTSPIQPNQLDRRCR
jgi:hypothetical protein